MPTMPHLHFNGNCREAFEYYARTLGGRIEFVLTCGETPMAQKMPPEAQNKVMHARVRLGSEVILGADVLGEHYHKPQRWARWRTPSAPLRP
jgi:PhnB protein